MTEKDKQRIHELLAERYAAKQIDMVGIEPRLAIYYARLIEEPEAHNAYELLSALKLLRLLHTYELDIETFRDVVFKYEGIWRITDDMWQHVEGGLKHPGTTGPMYYRLQPFQVFVLASMFLLKAWINTEAEIGTRGMLKTERPNPDGYIEDLRRLCTEFTFYTPRKTAKTQLSAFIQFWYFMSADENAECYCCANASDQAKILFSRSKDLIHQMDPREKRIRFTASQVNWKPGQFRTASLTALSAGGKTKDGLFAQLCSADEYGSAAYVNGASDMGKLVSVVESSMGPRREPMTFISTTAGIIAQGPFIDKLAGMKIQLEREADPEAVHELSTDRQMCLLLEPDEWEKLDTETLLTSKLVRRKVNPMLGIIVQHSFYDDEIAKARQNPEKMNEVISKLFNVYQSGRVTAWLKADQVRPNQRPRRITDCRYEEGWKRIFVGLDFGGTNDLFGVSYLGVNYFAPTAEGRFFADTEAWITRAALNASPHRELFEQWESQGWLHVVEGEVMESSYAIADIMSKAQRLNLYMFGYDPAQSKNPINELKAWLQTLGYDKKTLTSSVVSVPQTFLTMNGLVDEVEHMLLTQEPAPWLELSESPLWPWMFGNCKIEESPGSGLRKVMKTTQTQKVDCIHALFDALYCFDLSEGQVAE